MSILRASDQKGASRIAVVVLFVLGAGLALWLGLTVLQQNRTDTELSYTESSLRLNDEEVLSIDEFPDAIQVSEDATFGGSERIDGAVLSPDEEWIAVAVSGAAHSFGWVYNRETEVLDPVAFSYGGGVEVERWVDDETVEFIITTPRPETITETIDVNDLPEYPRVAE